MTSEVKYYNRCETAGVRRGFFGWRKKKSFIEQKYKISEIRCTERYYFYRSYFIASRVLRDCDKNDHDRAYRVQIYERRVATVLNYCKCKNVRK